MVCDPHLRSVGVSFVTIRIDVISFGLVISRIVSLVFGCIVSLAVRRRSTLFRIRLLHRLFRHRSAVIRDHFKSLICLTDYIPVVHIVD